MSIYGNILLIFSLVRTANLSRYTNIVLIFIPVRTAFLFFGFACFSTYKMVDREFIPENYRSSKIDIGIIIKNAKMQRFVPDYLKNTKMCQHAVNNLSLAIIRVPDRYKTQEMW